LILKEAGAEPEKIAAQQARVKAAEASVSNIEAQLQKTVLRSPITGVVTRQDAKIGEIIGANSVITSLISDAAFEIKANIPEVDITKVEVGDSARVTLDAYGNDVVFTVTVSMIDPAETVIEGVSTYKVTFGFEENDDRIRSGMTANIDVETERREQVLYVPQRAVITKDQLKLIRVVTGKNTFEEVEIEIGIRGSYGNIEIISGIEEGDQIVTFIKE